jgi:hypothetical protein
MVKVTEDSNASKIYDNYYVNTNGIELGKGTYGIVFKVTKLSNPREM